MPLPKLLEPGGLLTAKDTHPQMGRSPVGTKEETLKKEDIRLAAKVRGRSRSLDVCGAVPFAKKRGSQKVEYPRFPNLGLDSFICTSSLGLI